ncbi:hypothetical protein CEXT_352421 [Caerostris extrusa]|uniref:Uncharacterized protein n=1 Tax=Caerostris extrusa TaxID=172846 RepID=A0AAV4XHH8_CAEEX|nr:hypothetical protein CEXT_352421 [Caerostris extrusa]
MHVNPRAKMKHLRIMSDSLNDECLIGQIQFFALYKKDHAQFPFPYPAIVQYNCRNLSLEYAHLLLSKSVQFGIIMEEENLVISRGD